MICHRSPNTPAWRSLGRSTAALLLLLAAPSGCRSAEEFRAEADREVYALIQERREQLFAEGGPFSIDRPEDSLRDRMVSGAWVPGEPLTLLECIEIAAENNREVRARREQLYRAALDLTLERWRLGWQPFADGSASRSGVADDQQTTSGRADLGFTRLLGTGGSILAGIGSSLFKVVSTGDGWELVSDLRLSITQPLLRGAGIRVVREPLTQAERNLVYEVRAYERFRRTFAVQVASEVYDVLLFVAQVRNEESNLRTIRSLTERNVALAEAGRQSDIEVDQGRQNELRSENRLLQLNAQLQERYDRFCLFLGLPIDPRLRIDEGELERLDPVDSLFPAVDRVLEEPAVSLALEQRLDFMTTRDTWEDRVRRAAVLSDALRAGLNVSADVGASSEANRPLDYDTRSVDWTLGLGFDLPVNLIPQRNAYRSALIAAEAARRDVEQDGDTIRVNVRAALRDLRAIAESYKIQSGATVLAERRVESSQLSLEAGRASTRDLLESQDALLEARNAAIQALIDLTLARLDLYLQLEVLRVDEEGVRVEQDLLAELVGPEAEDGGPDPAGVLETNDEAGSRGAAEQQR